MLVSRDIVTLSVIVTHVYNHVMSLYGTTGGVCNLDVLFNHLLSQLDWVSKVSKNKQKQKVLTFQKLG